MRFTETSTTVLGRRLKSFVQFKGARTVDASALLMPIVKFIGPSDPRWLSTLQVSISNLVEDSLVYRYQLIQGAPLGFPGREGTFSMCSFWNVECLARSGDLDQARFYFEKALSYANHLGLYSEELGLEGRAARQFPAGLYPSGPDQCRLLVGRASREA